MSRHAPSSWGRFLTGVRQAWRVSQLASAGGHHYCGLRRGLDFGLTVFGFLGLPFARNGAAFLPLNPPFLRAISHAPVRQPAVAGMT